MSVNADLSGRRVLVVGASSGIGRAIALSAAAAGARIAVVGRRENLLDDLVKEAGGGIPIVADVSDDASAKRAVAEAVAGMGGVDAALLPFAWSSVGLLADADADMWNRTFATNVTAPTLVTRHVVPVLAEGGFIGYVSSISAAKPMHGLGAYGASKAALEHSILTWRLEHSDVRFLRIVVGPTLPTDFYRDYDWELVNKVTPRWVEHGLLEVNYLAVDEVGQVVAEAAAWILAHPAVVVEDLVLKPPLKIMTAAAVAATAAQADGSLPEGAADNALGKVQADRRAERAAEEHGHARA
ncbi:NADP-dependent 3-hydroxy acid dehydrogenase YdfG [Parafrankia irregularis]|uniref:NADP-dependent 3-hydroxy acid dehydrogenase YdfG n=1 Tax=Parafrankia irregularis TaxID=795642 RepID=A0A0S4QGS3_9ACTN|nr:MULTISPECIES: SDR family oxidoreductase [Parafrankia]MBE3200839.1 SDR family oxidoreductase [Parafrankia sp. CH37]CUU54768.1 NADP-dependent 3-hydroxy acid dehydrogenase YdfG [Parafrankia irregularis]